MLFAATRPVGSTSPGFVRRGRVNLPGSGGGLSVDIFVFIAERASECGHAWPLRPMRPRLTAAVAVRWAILASLLLLRRFGGSNGYFQGRCRHSRSTPIREGNHHLGFPNTHFIGNPHGVIEARASATLFEQRSN